ncbi:alpha/beta hydrolase [Dactylosporangium sp. NPDC000555]|uniref:alpha/beta hydrolase n=1 Tax=Dactylosporangium sp. NPDC000555 TaxID=3154260 RepID=UPI003321358C
MSDVVDPQLRPGLERLPVLDLTDLAAFRQTARRRAAAPADPGLARENHRVPAAAGHPGVDVRHYRRTDVVGSRGVVLWAHGGGHVRGSMDQDDLLLRALSRNVGCDAVAVGLRRAPEDPYPADVDDILATAEWIRDHAAALGVDGDRLVAAGSSAGAGAVAGATLLARDRGDQPFCFQVLTYPMLDDRTVPPHAHPVPDPRMWSPENNEFGWRAYLGPAFGTADVPAYAAPARATDLSGLPPAFLGVGALDLFLREDLEYAARLAEADVPVEVHVYPGAFHGFNTLVPDADVSARFDRDRNEALIRALRG